MHKIARSRQVAPLRASNLDGDIVLAKPSTPGDYIAVARACFGSGNCDLASIELTV